MSLILAIMSICGENYPVGMTLTEWEQHDIERAKRIISVIANDIERTTIKIPFEAEGYIAGAKDEHTYIVKYLREQLDI